MKKRIISLALALALVLALAPAVSAETNNIPMRIPSITIEVPGIPGMTIEMFNVFENYFYRESDGAVMFALGFPAIFLDGSIIDDWDDIDEDDLKNTKYASMVFDKDITLVYSGMNLWWGSDFDFTDGDEIYAPHNLTAEAGELFGTYIDGNADAWLDHYFTIDGVSVYFSQAAWVPWEVFITGAMGSYQHDEGLIGRWAELGFELLPMSGIVAEPDSTPPPPSSPLDDASEWARDDIVKAIELGLVPETLQDLYRQQTTRVEFAALAVALYETVTGEEITELLVFPDTLDINAQKMGALGVVEGFGDGTFRPDNLLSRQQAATMLARLADALDQPLAPHIATFPDSDTIADWAIDEVGQMQLSEVMGGFNDGTFRPRGNYLREQSITTMLRLFEILT